MGGELRKGKEKRVFFIGIAGRIAWPEAERRDAGKRGREDEGFHLGRDWS